MGAVLATWLAAGSVPADVGSAAPPSPLEHPTSDNPAIRAAAGTRTALSGDVTTRTLRFYEMRGLIAPGRKGANRVYSRRDRARLQLILRGKNLGFSIEEIGEYLALYDADPAQRRQTEMLLSRLEARIADLEGKRRDLERALKELGAIRDQCLSHLGRR